MQAVKARKDAIAGASRQGVERSLKTLKGCTVYEGHARFIADKKVAVNGFELDADRIFINVGGRASIPPIAGLDQVPYFTNSSMMDVDFLPSHLIILGGSYIGLEFAQVYRRFGSEVTVIELAPRLIAREDEDVSRAVAEFLKEEGIDVRVDSKVVGVEKQGNSIAVKIESAGKISQVVGNAGSGSDWSAAEHRRSWPGQGRYRHRSARLYSSGRSVAHQRARYLGDGRLQRPRRVYAHVVERFRDCSSEHLG